VGIAYRLVVFHRYEALSLEKLNPVCEYLCGGVHAGSHAKHPDVRGSALFEVAEQFVIEF
jgi:hypothetical protein